MGGGEDLFGGDVGQEDHPLFADAGGTLPDGLVGDADGQVGAVAALEVDALEVEGVHLVLQAGETVEVGLPLVDGVAVRHAADVEDELPELLDGRSLVQLRKIFFAHGALGMAAMDHWTRSFMVYSRHGAMNLRCAAFTRLIFAPSGPA